MERLFDDPLQVRSHKIGPGTQRIYRFPNGYGASVVRLKLGLVDSPAGDFYGSYTNNEEEWELAVVRFTDDVRQEEGLLFTLDYSTPITDDTIGYLSEDEVEEILQQIKALPAK